MIKPTPTERILAGQLFMKVKEEIRPRDVWQLLAEYRAELLQRVAEHQLDAECAVMLEEFARAWGPDGR